MSRKSPRSKRTPDLSVNTTASVMPEYVETQRDNSSDTVQYGMAVEQFEAHSGPIPSPVVLKGYAEIIPDGPERIMKMAEQQLEHNMKMEEKGLKAGIRSTYLGQILAFVLAILLIGVGAWLTCLGHETVGSIIFGTCLAGVIGLFIKGFISRKD